MKKLVIEQYLISQPSLVMKDEDGNMYAISHKGKFLNAQGDVVEKKEDAFKGGSVSYNMPFDVVGSLVAILFHADQQIGMKEVVERGKLKDKLEAAAKENAQYVLLDKEEAQHVTSAFGTFKKFNMESRELVERVQGMPEVEVDVKK